MRVTENDYSQAGVSGWPLSTPRCWVNRQ